MQSGGNQPKEFKAIDSRNYIGPKLDFEQPELQPNSDNKTRFPVFLGADGTLYDIYYDPVDKSSWENQKGKNDSTEDPLERLVVEENNVIPMPEPDDFQNFLDYEQACLDWKVKTEVALGYLRLPNVLGRSFYRPRINETDFDLEGRDNPDAIEDAENNPELEELMSGEQQAAEDFGISNKRILDTLTEVDIRTLEFDHDPWDSLLISVEPEPEMYDTFEEYECALKKWALICNQQTELLPPHASQLKHLIPIQCIADESQREDSRHEAIEEQDSSTGLWKFKTGLVYQAFFEPIENLVPANRYYSYKYERPKIQLNSHDIENSQKTKENIQKILYKYYEQQKDRFEKYNSYNSPTLPIIHGTFPKPWERAGTGNSPAASFSKKKIKLQSLRRKELSSALLDTCLDSPKSINGEEVEFKYDPEYDLNSLNVNNLAFDESYRKQVEKNIKQMQFAEKYDSLNSWYFPRTPKKELDSHTQFIDSILEKCNQKPTIDILFEIFSGAMYLDRFQDLLNESMPDEDLTGSSPSYLACFLSCLTTENFPDLLCLFDYCASTLSHAKLAAFVSEALQSGSAKSLLEPLIIQKNVNGLAHIAYAMSFFSDVPLDIFPYRDETKHIILQLVGKSVDEILSQLFCYYYVGIIGDTILKQPFIFVAINQFAGEAKKNIGQNLGSMLNENSEFLGKQLWQCLGHRSSTISSFTLFILIQFMNATDALSIQTSLKSENTNILEQIRILSHSKFVHVQYAVKRVFELLTKGTWLDFIFAVYCKNPELVIEDLKDTPPKASAPSLITSLVQEMCCNALQQATKELTKRISFILDESFFLTLLSEIITNIKSIEHTHVVFSQLLAELAKTYGKLGLIHASDKLVVSKSQRKGSLSLTLSVMDFLDPQSGLISLISNASGSDRTKTFAVKTNILKCLRYLIKQEDIFEFIKKEQDFYSKSLHSWCRDKTNNSFNREAWRLFYQSIRYHPGIMEFLNKNKLLVPFLELVGTSSDYVVMMNGLHYISKLFTMQSSETRNSVRKDVKTVEKDIKILSTFFINRCLFIKIHMIYKKFTEQILYPGAVFQELANFYFILYNVPDCTKLKKDTFKKAEYKDGIIHINSMFGKNMDENLLISSDGAKTPEAKVTKGRKSFAKITLRRSDSVRV